MAPTRNNKVLKEWLQNYYHSEEACLLDSCALWLSNSSMTFQRNVLPSTSGLWICGLPHNPKDEGCTFLQIFGKKIPDHMAQQNTISASSTIRWWKPQHHCFHIVKNMFHYYYIFIVTVFFWCKTDFLWKNVMINVFIIFECQYPWI